MVLAPGSLELARQRARFLEHGDGCPEVRPEITTSWRRSRLCGVDPRRYAVPFDCRDAAGGVRLRRLAVPVLSGFADHLAETNTSLALTDQAGRILWRWVSARHLRSQMDRLSVATGFRFAEECVGTNGIGMALELRRPVQVNGYEHFVEALDVFCCTAAPVRDPISGRLLGAMNITCRVAEASELLLPMIAQLADEVETRLADEASPTERLLLAAFAAARRRTRRPLFALNAEVLIADRAATDLLADLDREWLWEQVRRSLAGPGTPCLVQRPALRLRCQRVGCPDGVVGAVVVIEPAEPAAARHRRVAQPPVLAGLYGESPAWSGVVRGVHARTTSRAPLLVYGEAGVGKAAVLRALAALTGRPVRVVDCRDECVAGTERVVAMAEAALREPSGLVLLRHVESLSPAAVHLLGPTLDAAIAGSSSWTAPRLTATATTGGADPELPRALLDRLADRLRVPPLRSRPADIRAVLAGTSASAGGSLAVRGDALRLLERYPWPGNVRQLLHLVHGLTAGRVGVLTADDLPAELRLARSARPLSPVEEAERSLLVQALDRSGGNRSKAARMLGLSRSTLYRRLRAYQIRG